MKKRNKIVVLALMLAFATGCGQQAGSNKAAGNMQSNVDKVMQEQMENAERSTQGELPDDKEGALAVDKVKAGLESEAGSLDSPVDYDLTSMNSDMVYSTVYQMMTDPQTYVGKTVRMDGAYIVNYWESTDTYYHCVLVKDAQACCQQGIEFVWGDGSHVYPDDYPAENTDVLVTGTFETYQEDGDDNLYCRLKDATLTLE